MDRKNFSRPLSLRSVQITDDFWKKEMELVRTQMLPYQWDALNDQVEGAVSSYCMRNFKIAGKKNLERRERGETFREPSYTFRGFEALPQDPRHPEDKFYGFVFQDSDFYKWIEAVGYSLTQHPDQELEKTADHAIDMVCAAQQEDGYLDTYYILNGKDKIFTNLKDHHELYCLGHLIEGAVAYYQATGKDKLLKAAMRYADYTAEHFGPEEGKCKGYPGHEIAEMALVRLFEATGEEKYLNLGKFFVDERGRRPYYFDKEHPEGVKDQPGGLRYAYNQAHIPVREQEEAVGHAVRAVYLYSGMTDIARLTQDESLYKACEKLWDNMVDRKMYITGGIGGTQIGEAFSFNYDLPNDTAYAETCAAIGLVFFARRMLEMKPDSRYGDVMERALYNCILSGMALDGKSFFYVNPLEVNPEACHKDERKAHVKPVRQKWFGCSCCPPNLARLLSSLSAYAFTETEDTLFVHLYMGSIVKKQVNGKEVTISISSGLPHSGKVAIEVSGESVPFTIALRIPDWCREEAGGEKAQTGFTLKGVQDGACVMRDGYLYVTKSWNPGEPITLEFAMDVKILQADPRVREDIGRVAVARGPVVYCLEEADNGADLHLLTVDCSAGTRTEVYTVAGEPVTSVVADGFRQKLPSFGKGLYHSLKAAVKEPVKLRFIPYYVWANRGENEMTVWVRQEK
nr:beta-L-arabinofuranosidase domain-containing protein [uncultured Blautia sp.]